MQCTCGKKSVKLTETGQIGEIISGIVDTKMRKGKVSIKVEIEFDH